MEATKPEVTTIIPTHDREGWLPRTLLSALGQEGIETEVIVVDDGSRVPVTTYLAPELDARVRIIRHDVPKGQAAARNAGIREARGRWVALLDDDDVWAPTKSRRQLEVAAETDADFVACGAVVANGDGVPLGVVNPPGTDEPLHRALLQANVIPPSSLLAKTDLVRSVGAFDTKLEHLCDWDLAIRLSAQGTGAMTSEMLVGYTIHPGNFHHDEASILAVDRRRFDQKYAEEWARTGTSLDRTRWLRWRAGAEREGGRRLGAAVEYLKLGWVSRDPGVAVRGVILALGGEGVMRVARRVRHRGKPEPATPAPSWLPLAAIPSAAELRAVLR
jgi:glycosyltransferase involved in cell wall biosynthesis